MEGFNKQHAAPAVTPAVFTDIVIWGGHQQLPYASDLNGDRNDKMITND
jgi:hypothetical protein